MPALGEAAHMHWTQYLAGSADVTTKTGNPKKWGSIHKLASVNRRVLELRSPVDP